MADLIERLRALSRHEHDDLSIGDEAADEVERMRAALAQSVETVRELRAERDALRSRIEGALVVHDVTGKYGFVGQHVALVVLND